MKWLICAEKTKKNFKAKKFACGPIFSNWRSIKMTASYWWIKTKIKKAMKKLKAICVKSKPKSIRILKILFLTKITILDSKRRQSQLVPYSCKWKKKIKIILKVRRMMMIMKKLIQNPNPLALYLAKNLSWKMRNHSISLLDGFIDKS